MVVVLTKKLMTEINRKTTKPAKQQVIKNVVQHSSRTIF